MEVIKSGKLNPAGLMTAPAGSWQARLEGVAAPTLAQLAQPRMLRMLTEAVDIAKRPVEEQKEALGRLEDEVKRLSVRDYYVRLLMPAVAKVGEAAVRDKAILRYALAAAAAERFRRDKGRWPETLDELVPAYLARVPADPYDGKPLRFNRLPDGVLVYSVGPDRKDDGGALNRARVVNPGTDMGFRLWDAGRRRQAPAELLPMPSEGFPSS